jgi:DDE superfamily endonuclease
LEDRPCGTRRRIGKTNFNAGLRQKARRRMCPLYVAGLIGPGERKSIQPMAERLRRANTISCTISWRIVNSVEEGFIAELGFGSADIVQHETQVPSEPLNIDSRAALGIETKISDEYFRIGISEIADRGGVEESF